MTTENLSNNAVTTLTANVGLSDTTISVASSTGFPAVNFRVLIDAEIMLVTVVSGTTWAVTRGQESTTVAGHTLGGSVANVLTVAGLANAIASSGGGSGDLLAANNLSDLASESTARTNLGLGSAATHASTDFAPSSGIAESAVTNLTTDLAGKLVAANNLSDVASAATSRTNLGLGSASTHASTDFAPSSGIAESAVTNLTTDLAAKLVAANNLSDVSSASTSRTNLGLGSAATLTAAAANGAATLDGSGHLTAAQIPSGLVGAVVYQGTWNATTNTPTLVSSTGTQGNYYVVSTAGTTSINSIASWNVGDWIIFNGSIWNKIDGISSEVVSVAGRTGAVTIANTDVSGLGTASTQSTGTFCQVANNLSDVTAATALANILPSQTSNSGKFLGTNGTTASWTAGNLGTVTSVALTVPSFLTAGGTPITSSGTLAITLATETANTVFAGPSSGPVGTPTFRALVAGDIPALAESGITNLTTDLAARLVASNNLSDVSNASTSRTNLGLGTAATQSTGTFCQTANNLSDVASMVGTCDTIHTKGTTIASASTTNLSTATGLCVDISGTTTITAFGTSAAGVLRFLRFTGALTLTYNATSLILPTSANITTANGDTALFESLGSGNWLCQYYTLANGHSPAGGGGGVTSVAMTGDGTIFNSTVSGSPITTSGTLAPALLTQSANLMFGGPSSGPAANPTFRALAAADMPKATSSALGAVEVPATGGLSVDGSGNITLGTLSATLTSQVASQASILAHTTPANLSTWMITIACTVNSSSSGNVAFAVTYHDETNTSRTLTFPITGGNGSFTNNASFAGNAYSGSLFIRTYNSTSITVASTVTLTINYDCNVCLLQLTNS